MDDHSGHRQRMIEKLRREAICDHEMLEILLFNAMPRRNTNDLAHRLLSTFGSVKGIFSAKMEQLEAVEGVGPRIAAYLKCCSYVCRAYSDRRYLTHKHPKIYKDSDFRKFIEKYYKNKKKEFLDIYCLDAADKIFYLECFTSDQETTVSIADEVIETILAVCEPASIVVVHNHPKGESFPSELDDEATRKIYFICKMYDTTFGDHYIYAKDGVYSYFQSGRLTKIGIELLEAVSE